MKIDPQLLKTRLVNFNLPNTLDKPHLNQSEAISRATMIRRHKRWRVDALSVNKRKIFDFERILMWKKGHKIHILDKDNTKFVWHSVVNITVDTRGSNYTINSPSALWLLNRTTRVHCDVKSAVPHSIMYCLIIKWGLAQFSQLDVIRLKCSPIKLVKT